MKKDILAGCLALALCLGLLSMTAPAAMVTDSGEVAVETPPGEDAVAAELAALGEWITVHGIEGGQIRFDSSTGKITNCEKSVTSANIPATISAVGVTGISDGAFEDCTGLTTVTIPDSVTSIGRDVFSGCSGLTGITIPGSVTFIGVDTFAGCTGLKTAGPIGSGCDFQFGWTGKIPAGAFTDLSGLTRVTIPAGVTEMEDNLAGNYALTAINIDPGNPTWSSRDGVLLSKAGDVLKLCPRAKTACVIPDTVKTIAPSAFSGCTRLTGVTIPDSVTGIGDYAFNECTGLTGVTIPKSVTGIGRSAFSQCAGLKTVTIPGPASLDDYAFYGCTGLKSVSIAEGVQTIPDSLFKGCSALEIISIPLSVTTVGASAFRNCTSLKTVNYAGDDIQWDQIDIQTDNQDLKLAAVNFGVPADPAPPAGSITPEPMPLSCTPVGPEYKVTLTVAAGHWLTVQTRRAGSVALTSLKAPGSGGSTAQVTLSACTDSVIQAWETQEEMTFTDGVPDKVVLSTAVLDLSAQAQLLSGKAEETARPASVLQTAGAQMLGEVGGDSISVTMNDLAPNSYYLGAVWDEGRLLALFDAAADGNGAFYGEVKIGTTVEPGLDYRVGVSAANVGGGEAIKSQVVQTGGSGVTVERSGSTVVVSDPKGKLATCETVIAARYSEQGKMLDVTTAPYAGSGTGLRFTKAPESAYRWRFFFLDSQNDPLCERVFLTK